MIGPNTPPLSTPPIPPIPPAAQPAPPPPGYAAQCAVMPVVPRRGWWAKNWKWAVPTGVAVIFGTVIGFVALLFTFVLGMVRGTEVYATALSEARSDPAVVAAIGTPIDEDGLFQGNIEMTPSSGYADLAIPIEGPSGSATIYVEAEKVRGEWIYDTLEVAVHDSWETIDLLDDW